MRIFRYIMLLILTGTIYGCQRENMGQIYSPATDTTSVGTIYFQGGDSLYSVDINEGKIKWRIKQYSIFDTDGSYYTYLNNDSGYLYKGNNYEMVCYNANTGIWLWHHTFGTFYSSSSPAEFTQKVIFADTVLYVIQAHPLPGHRVYCLSKKTGREIWSQRIFIGGGSGFAGVVPVISGDKVYVAGSNLGVNVIYCFNRLTGQKIWESSISNSTSRLLEIDNNNIISWDPYKTFCLDKATGNLIWQNSYPRTGTGIRSTDIFPATTRTLLLEGWNNFSEAHWVNKSTGAIESAFQFPDLYRQCAVKGDEIIFINAESTADSIAVSNWNINSFTKNWGKKISKVKKDSYPSDRFSPAIQAEKQLVFQEEASAPSLIWKQRFNFIDFSTGKIDKQITVEIQSMTPLFSMSRHGRSYTANY